MNEQDRKVQATNTDATISKLSCVQAGYMQDEFVHLFVSSGGIRRNPIINLGHYIRSMTMRRVIETFLSSNSNTESQIISIGAGNDTNLLCASQKFAHVKFFEIDFLDVVLHKLKVLKRDWNDKFQFMSLTDFPDFFIHKDGEIVWNSGSFSVFSADLRSSTDSLLEKLHACGFDRLKPTLIISECCLVYLDHKISEKLLSFYSSLAEQVTVALYEQVNSEDAFGKMMVDNLLLRGCPLLSILPNIDSVKKRFTQCGYKSNRVELMTHFGSLFKHVRPEIIDEMEEFNLFQEHYFLGIASNQETLGAMNYVFTQNDS